MSALSHAGLERILTKNPAYDARSLVEGIGPMLDSLLSRVMSDPAYLVQGMQPLYVAPADRAVAIQALGDGVKVDQNGWYLLTTYKMMPIDTRTDGAVSSSRLGCRLARLYMASS